MKHNALPISIKEFADALFKRPCQVPYRHDQRGHRTLGMYFKCATIHHCILTI